MEFLRDGGIGKAESQTEETSKDIAIINCGEKRESNLGDSAVGLETPEVWYADQQGKIKKGTRGNLLNWFKVIGKLRILEERGYSNSNFFQRRRCCPVLFFFLV